MMLKLLSIFMSVLMLSVAGCQEEQVDPNTIETDSQSTISNNATTEKLTAADSKLKHPRYSILNDTLRNNIDTLEVDSIAIANADSLFLQGDTIDLRILSIGNSFSRDALCYVPFILNELLPTVRLHLTIMYRGGRPLKDHWSAMQSGGKEYQRDTYTTENGMWKTENARDLVSEMDSTNNWDLIIFQQASGHSPSYDTYQPYLSNLIRTVRTNFTNTKIGWLLTPAHPNGYEKMPTLTSTDMWQLICDATEQVTRDEHIDVVLPGGTAIQNARHTRLDSLGVFGHLTYEGLHLQDGLPRLIESYTLAQAFINFFHLGGNILNSTLRPTQQWALEHRIPEMHGLVIEGTDDDYALCKRLALTAISNPYVLYVP